MVTSHVIALYPTLVKRLVARGWKVGHYLAQKRRGKYVYYALLDYTNQRATFSRYERLSK